MKIRLFLLIMFFSSLKSQRSLESFENEVFIHYQTFILCHIYIYSQSTSYFLKQWNMSCVSYYIRNITPAVDFSMINIHSLNYLKGLNQKLHLSADSIDYEGLDSLTRNDLSKRNGDQGLRYNIWYCSYSFYCTVQVQSCYQKIILVLDSSIILFQIKQT